MASTATTSFHSLSVSGKGFLFINVSVVNDLAGNCDVGTVQNPECRKRTNGAVPFRFLQGRLLLRNLVDQCSVIHSPLRKKKAWLIASQAFGCHVSIAAVASYSAYA